MKALHWILLACFISQTLLFCWEYLRVEMLLDERAQDQGEIRQANRALKMCLQEVRP